VSYNSNENYFCPVKLIPNTIEYLSLNRPNHLRVLFSRTDTDWSGEFLVPFFFNLEGVEQILF
jgi:hypothetical protein